MPVARRGDISEPLKQVEFHALRTFKGIVHPVFIAAVYIAAFIVFIDELAIHREQVNVFILRLCEPREMVHADNVYINLRALRLFHSAQLRDRLGKQLLRAEHLVAAAERLDFREHAVERIHADRHRICVVDNPRLGAIIADCARNHLIHRHRAQGAHNPARTGGIADRLINSVFLRRVDVGLHFVKCAGQNRNYDKIRAAERLFDCIARLISPH